VSEASVFCHKCGHHLRIEDDAKIDNNLDPDDDLLDEDEQYCKPPVSESLNELFKAVIGPNNRSYYLSRFHRFENNGRASASWNWPAFFIPFFWGLYRKMWAACIAYFLIFILLKLFSRSGGPNVYSLFPYFIIIIHIVVSLNANELYYKHCKQKIKEAKLLSGKHEERCAELSRVGGTSNVVLWVLVILGALSVFSAFFIPYTHEGAQRRASVDTETSRQQAETDALQAAVDEIPELALWQFEAQTGKDRARWDAAVEVYNLVEKSPEFSRWPVSKKLEVVRLIVNAEFEDPGYSRWPVSKKLEIARLIVNAEFEKKTPKNRK
jgi:hypothetical protein